MAATPKGGFFYTELAYIDEDGNGVYYREGAFNSDETIPTAATGLTDTASGSFVIRPDNGKVYFYNRPGDAWVEQFSFQS